jgi:hypothetical protein
MVMRYSNRLYQIDLNMGGWDMPKVGHTDREQIHGQRGAGDHTSRRGVPRMSGGEADTHTISTGGTVASGKAYGASFCASISEGPSLHQQQQV